ncbi:MAG: MT-A70 family methyltransferase [Pseudolabrys sp.]
MTQARPSIAIARIKLGHRHRRDLGDIAALAANIKEIGLLHPVVIRRDGTLIAGARRIAAAKTLGWKKIPATVIDLDDILRGEFAENAYCKNFTLSESVAIADALEALERKAAKARQAAAGPSSGRGKKATASVKFTEPVRGQALDKVAKALGMSRPTLQRARAIVTAAKIDPAFAKLQQAMDKTSKVNGPFRRLKATQQAKILRCEVPPLPGNGPYRVGMIDVPWAYEPNDDSPTRGVLDYPTLSIRQACALDIDSRMHKDAVLFCWVTNFILARGLHLEPLTAWGGFEPKTIITWPKDRHTFKAHWLRGQTEHMVMAVRGKPVITLTDQTTLLKGPFHPVREGAHSAKPVEAYDFVERLCPAPRYCDLFSRYQHSSKWDCHGDQAPISTNSKGPDHAVEALATINGGNAQPSG